MVNKHEDTHLAGQLVGFLGSLIGGGDHGWEAPLTPLLLIVFCIFLLVRPKVSMRSNTTLGENK